MISSETKQTNGNSRYCVGIDLGTTNSVLSYVDMTASELSPVCLPIPQLVARGEIQSLPELPSFLYLCDEQESQDKAYWLPWNNSPVSEVIGDWAREMSALSPNRVVSSSKSWLCKDDIDRHSQCLPLTSDGRKLSPVTASQRILEHLRDAWNYSMAKEDSSLLLENQDVVITVPASFDAVARELTVEAARNAGLTFTLLEEPQASFYSWLACHRDDWRKILKAGDVVLVCDIGGGTTDFSLISVVDDNGNLSLERLAVGDHTLLGGDNMDLTLTYNVAAVYKKEQHGTLNAYQLTALTHSCRKAKEYFGNGGEEDCSLPILGRGSSLVGGALNLKLTHSAAQEILVNGFFPDCELYSSTLKTQRTGLRTRGLNYAEDPAITHHLSPFLSSHQTKSGGVPRFVLFNGGVTKSAIFRNLLLEQLTRWSAEGSVPPVCLEQEDSDLSVARGAAWYGCVRRTDGIRIKAGSSRAYYIGIESTMPAVPGFEAPMDALCVVPFGMEEGTECAIPEKGLALVVGETTEFRFFSSTTRLEDKPGERISDLDDGELEELASLSGMLTLDDAESSSSSLVPVTLRSVLTDIGTLQLWCDEENGDHSWQLEFDLREDASETQEPQE